MGRSSLLRRSLLLPFLRHNAPLQSSFPNTPPLPSLATVPTSQSTHPFLHPFPAAISLHYPHPSVFRLFSSSGGPSNLVLIESEQELKNSLKKAQDDNLPTVFYFTAVWCGPCRFIAPIIEELSNKHPNVHVYKVDIDKEGLESLLSTLKIFSVPTFHFFKNGKREAEIVGADATQLKNTMENLYK